MDILTCQVMSDQRAADVDELTQVPMQASDEEVEYARQQLGDLTYGDIHGRFLQSDGSQPPNPLSRVLSWQYK